MNVTIVEYYVPGCGDCVSVVANIVNSALPDPTVSRMSLVATGSRHCHHVDEKPLQQRMVAGATGALAAPAYPPVPSGVLFSEDEVAGLAGRSGDLPNGFDHAADPRN